MFLLNNVLTDEVFEKAGCTARKCSISFRDDLQQELEAVEHGVKEVATLELPKSALVDSPGLVQRRYIIWARELHEYQTV